MPSAVVDDEVGDDLVGVEPVEVSDADAERTRPPRRLRILGRPRFAGLVGALLCLWPSFWPTLMPRTFVTQGAMSGISMAFGYGVFTLLALIVRRTLARRHVAISPSARRVAWIVLAVAALAEAVVGGIWMWSRWQNDQRDLLGMDDISAVSGVPMLAIAVVVAAVLIVVGRMIGRGVAAIFNLVNRYVSRATSSVITAMVVALVGWVLFSDVVSDGFRSWANRTFGAVDEGTAEGVERPDSPTVSGSPDSLAAWDTLGFEGRSFVAAATDRDTIRRFQESIGNGDADVVDPIRVYAGIDSADDLDERADLVVDELVRTGRFDREVLVVATTTGTGWIDPNSATTLELMHRGDTTIASLQYSFLPSWIAFLVDEPVAAEAGAALFDAVYRRWAELPEDTRPHLIVYGLSLGSFGAEAGFAGTLADSSIANLQARTDGVLLAGPTHDNPVRQQIAEDRQRGSPVWRPVFEDGAVVRWFNGAAELAQLDASWAAPRLVYVGHASDPVRAWSWSGLWSPPDWMDQPRGPDVPKGGPWVPFVTFTQSVFDLMAGFGAPPGHGHDYRPEWPGAWAQVVPDEGWTAQDTEALSRFMDAIYAEDDDPSGS